MALFWSPDEAWTVIERICQRNSLAPVGLMIDG